MLGKRFDPHHRQFPSSCGSNSSLKQVKPLDNCGVINHMIYPHDVFSLIFKKYRVGFEVHFGALPTSLRSFWSKFLLTGYGRIAAVALDVFRGKTPDDLDHCIPLVIHGDACPVTHKRSALLTQWGSLLGHHQIRPHYKIIMIRTWPLADVLC